MFTIENWSDPNNLMMNSKLLVKKEKAQTISTKEIVFIVFFFLKLIKWKQNNNPVKDQARAWLSVSMSTHEGWWVDSCGHIPRCPPFPLMSTIFPLQLLQGSMISKVRDPMKTSNLEFVYRMSDCGSLMKPGQGTNQRV